MANTKVGGKKKSKDHEPKGNSEKLKIGEEKTDSGDRDRVLRSRTKTKEEGNVGGKAKGKKAMEEGGKSTMNNGVRKVEKSGKRKVMSDEENEEKAETLVEIARNSDGKGNGKKVRGRKGKLTTNDVVGKVESSGKRKVTAEEENQKKAGTPAERARNADGKAKGKKAVAEKGKSTMKDGVDKVEKSRKRKVMVAEENQEKAGLPDDRVRNRDGNDKGKKAVAEKGKSTKNSGVGKVENSGKRKIMAEEENQEKAGTSAKRVRNAEKSEKEKSNSGGNDRVLRPRNERVGYKSLNLKAKREKSEPKRKLGVGEENSQKAKTPTNALAVEGSYKMRERKGSFRKVDVSESGFVQIVGKRVKIFSLSSRRWIIGEIKSFDAKKQLHKVLYDNGDSEELDLKIQRFEIEVLPGEALSLSSNENPNTRKKQINAKTEREGSPEPEEQKSKPAGKGSRRATKEGESELQEEEKDVEKKSKPTRKGSRRATIENESKLQKEKAVDKKVNNAKGKEKIPNEESDGQREDREEIDEETDIDGDMLISDIAKRNGHFMSPLKIGKDKSMQKNQKLGKTMESKKRISKRVSEAQASKKTKKDRTQVSVDSRKKTGRKGRADAKTRN